MLMLKPKMLNLMFEDEIVATIRDGGVLNYDGIYLSPARAGGNVGEGYSLVEAPEPEPPTPEEARALMRPLTARQLRLGLVGGGFSLSQVETAIAAIPDEQQRAVAEVEWEYATQFERMHPLIGQVGGAFGLTPEQIDAMWTAALEL